MAVALVATSTSGTTDAQASSRTCPVPVGAASTHVAVLTLEIWQSTSTDPTITWPAGFTQIGYLESTTDGFQRLYIALKVLSASDAGNYSMSWSGSYWNQAQCSLWSGVDGTTPLDVALNAAQNASGTAYPSNSLTTAAAGCGMLYVVANENSATSLAPTGYTEQQEANYLKTFTKIAGAAGSESIAGGSLSASTLKLGALIALRPAGGGGGTNNTAAGPATETDTAQSAGRTRTSTVTNAAEADTAQPATRTRTSILGRSLETDAAQPAARTRTSTAGPAVEVDQAQPVSASGTPVTPAAETDTGQTVGRTRLSAAGVALESDQPQPAGRTRLTGSAAALEVDVAQPAGRTRSTPAGPALETDTAQPAINPGAIIYDLLLEALTEPAKVRVTIEPDRWTSHTEPNRYRLEVEA